VEHFVVGHRGGVGDVDDDLRGVAAAKAVGDGVGEGGAAGEAGGGREAEAAVGLEIQAAVEPGGVEAGDEERIQVGVGVVAEHARNDEGPPGVDAVAVVLGDRGGVLHVEGDGGGVTPPMPSLTV
jgi:hypothetical protein